MSEHGPWGRGMSHSDDEIESDRARYLVGRPRKMSTSLTKSVLDPGLIEPKVEEVYLLRRDRDIDDGRAHTNSSLSLRTKTLDDNKYYALLTLPPISEANTAGT